MHLLIFLDPAYKIRDASDVDSIVSAQIPDPVENPVLYNIVTQSMVHGPCGNEKPDAKCMVDGHCSKHFRKEFCENTQFGDDGYPKYARPNNGRSFVKGGFEYDNRDVVPYNPYLSAKYNCHINVEICKSTYTRGMIEQLWRSQVTSKEMKSKNIWMHDIFQLLKAVGTFLNFQCIQNHQLYIDCLFTWKISN